MKMQARISDLFSDSGLYFFIQLYAAMDDDSNPPLALVGSDGFSKAGKSRFNERF